MVISGSDYKAIGGFIRERRLAKGFSARQLAERVGVSDVHILYIESGRRKATFEKIVNILAALGSSYAEMMAATGLATGDAAGPADGKSRRLTRAVPVVTLVTAGHWHEVCDAFEPGDADEWIESDIQGENVFALRVAGDSMEPEFREGEIIIVNPHVEAAPNDFVVVKNKNEEATFKQLKRYGPRWVLHPLNPRYDDQEVRRGEFKIIGRVVKKEKRY